MTFGCVLDLFVFPLLDLFASLTDYLCVTSAWIKDLDFTVCLQCVLFLVFLTHNLFSVGGLLVGHAQNIPTRRCLGAATADTEALRWILSMWNMKHSLKLLLNLLTRRPHTCDRKLISAPSYSFSRYPQIVLTGGRGDVASWQLRAHVSLYYSLAVTANQSALPDTRTKTQRYLNSSTWGSN